MRLPTEPHLRDLDRTAQLPASTLQKDRVELSDSDSMIQPLDKISVQHMWLCCATAELFQKNKLFEALQNSDRASLQVLVWTDLSHNISFQRISKWVLPLIFDFSEE